MASAMDLNNLVRLSPTLGHSCNGIVAISPDGLQCALAGIDSIDVYCCSSLTKLRTYPTQRRIERLRAMLFSSHQDDSLRCLIWMEALSGRISLIELETGRLKEIILQPSIEIVSLIWGSSKYSEFLLYVSELEVYVGAYDEGMRTSFNFEGCTLDVSKKPLLSISPDKQHICYPSSSRILVISTKYWTRLADIDTQCCNISPRPIFYSNVSIFVATSTDNLWRSISGSNPKTQPLDWSTALPIKAMTLSNDRRRLFALCCSYENEQVAIYDTIRMSAEMKNIEYMTVCGSWFIAPGFPKNVRSLSLQFYREKSSCFDLASLKNNADDAQTFKYLATVNATDTHLALFSSRFPRVVWICNLTSITDRASDVVVVLAEEAGRVKELLWHSNFLAIVCLNSVVVWTIGGGVTAISGKKLSFEWLPSSRPASGILTYEDEQESTYHACFACFVKIDGAGCHVTTY